jgi:hypothetical protein
MKTKQNPGHISKRQKLIIDDLLKNGLNECEVLDKYKISPCRYRKWLENDLFLRELKAYSEAAARQKTLTLLHQQSKVIQRLAKMIDEEKGETLRKACRDLLQLRHDDVYSQKMHDDVFPCRTVI